MNNFGVRTTKWVTREEMIREQLAVKASGGFFGPTYFGCNKNMITIYFEDGGQYVVYCDLIGLMNTKIVEKTAKVPWYRKFVASIKMFFYEHLA